MVGEFIFGCSQKVRENIWEIDMRAIGQMELGKAMECFIMQMEPNIKDTGKTTWNKDMLFIQTRTEKSHICYSIEIEC